MKRSYPALAQLFGCYLHQDWTVEFDTAADAVAAFLAHATPHTRMAAREEIGRLLAHAETEAKLVAQLEKLGCYYWPAGDGITAREWIGQLAEQIGAE